MDRFYTVQSKHSYDVLLGRNRGCIFKGNKYNINMSNILIFIRSIAENNTNISEKEIFSEQY